MTSLSHEEHAEHAEHAALHGNKMAALLIAVLAAALAICEQQAKRAEISVEANAILAADTWNEYQAKSVRSAMAQDLERVAATLDTPTEPDRAALRDAALKRLRSALRERDVGGVTIMKRGSAVDVEGLRRDLRLSGAKQTVVVLALIGGRHHAVIADAVKA